MEKRAGRTGFAAVTILLMLVAAFFAGETASGRATGDAREGESYTAGARQLTREVAGLLAGEGLADSGVMVTRAVEEDGGYLCTVSVHHRDILRMSDEQKALLLERIENICSPAEGYRFCARFH